MEIISKVFGWILGADIFSFCYLFLAARRNRLSWAALLFQRSARQTWVSFLMLSLILTGLSVFGLFELILGWPSVVWSFLVLAITIAWILFSNRTAKGSYPKFIEAKKTVRDLVFVAVATIVWFGVIWFFRNYAESFFTILCYVGGAIFCIVLFIVGLSVLLVVFYILVYMICLLFENMLLLMSLTLILLGGYAVFFAWQHGNHSQAIWAATGLVFLNIFWLEWRGVQEEIRSWRQDTETLEDSLKKTRKELQVLEAELETARRNFQDTTEYLQRSSTTIAEMEDKARGVNILRTVLAEEVAVAIFGVKSANPALKLQVVREILEQVQARLLAFLSETDEGTLCAQLFRGEKQFKMRLASKKNKRQPPPSVPENANY